MTLSGGIKISTQCYTCSAGAERKSRVNGSQSQCIFTLAVQLVNLQQIEQHNKHTTTYWISDRNSEKLRSMFFCFIFFPGKTFRFVGYIRSEMSQAILLRSLKCAHSISQKQGHLSVSSPAILRSHDQKDWSIFSVLWFGDEVCCVDRIFVFCWQVKGPFNNGNNANVSPIGRSAQLKQRGLKTHTKRPEDKRTSRKTEPSRLNVVGICASRHCFVLRVPCGRVDNSPNATPIGRSAQLKQRGLKKVENSHKTPRRQKNLKKAGAMHQATSIRMGPGFIFSHCVAHRIQCAWGPMNTGDVPKFTHRHHRSSRPSNLTFTLMLE